MTHDEAIEFMEFNVVGAYVGEDTTLAGWLNCRIIPAIASSNPSAVFILSPLILFT